MYFSTAYVSFDEITSNRKVAATLKYLYGNVHCIDLWVGGISEEHEKGSEFGETFRTIIVDQLTRIRDGDRFWYENTMSKKVSGRYIMICKLILDGC